MKRLVLIALAGALLAGLAVPAVAGVAGSAGPAASVWNSSWFRSPTGNIRCRYWPGDLLLACTTLNNRRLTGVTLNGGSFVRQSHGYSFPGGPVLTYGDSWSVRGRFRCVSRYNGMTCESLRTGSGFLIHRTGYRLF